MAIVSGDRLRLSCGLILCLLLGANICKSQSQSATVNDGVSKLTLATDSVGPQRFLAVHGTRSLIQGYATHGLEVWAYPIQIVGDYEVGFRHEGSATVTDGASLLRKITYEPEAVTRTYIGPDFVVSERLFVPLDQPSAIITYTIDSREPVDVVVRFSPILNLMWPGSIGGQSASWDSKASAYVVREPSHKFSAFIGSPDTILHDGTVNSAQPSSHERSFAFAMRAGGVNQHRSATVAIGMLENAATEPAQALASLLSDEKKLETEARTHYEKLESSTLQILTPDDSVNSALAWAGVALDQAWACNPYLGCGPIAGYGPSRDARRPQYEWFFAGDGLTTIEALLAAGRYDRARDALRFIIKYQDPKSGMIWHELSQSASFLDWANSYPYMYVHVDISFQFLNTVAQYAKVSGDKQFIIDNWASLQAAYNYCKTLSDPTDSLPRIPKTKEGGNEQDRLTDELDLSVSWLTASQSFAQLAELAGHESDAVEAKQISAHAQQSIAARYWIKDSNKWIDGYNESGKPVMGSGIGGITLIERGILPEAPKNLLLDQIASSDFQTDWGTRSVASNSPDFDPNSYAKGSVWGIGTADVAATFWTQHRPATAFPIWNSLIQWNSFDSLGHLHEVMAGDVFHQQTESVPEQTWSSAALLSSTARGLLGLDLNAQTKQLTFAPHLPAEWNTLRVKGVRTPTGTVNLTVVRTSHGIDLSVENEGEPVSLRFAPAVPLGARLTGGSVNDKAAGAQLSNNDQDSHAALDLQLPHGATKASINFTGGVSIAVPHRVLLPGDRSRGTKLTSVSLKGARLVIAADVDASREASILLRTDDKIANVSAATLRPLENGWSELVIAPPANSATATSPYRKVELAVEFSTSKTAKP